MFVEDGGVGVLVLVMGVLCSVAFCFSIFSLVMAFCGGVGFGAVGAICCGAVEVEVVGVRLYSIASSSIGRLGIGEKRISERRFVHRSRSLMQSQGITYRPAAVPL